MNFKESGAIVSLMVNHINTSRDYDTSDILDMETDEWKDKWRSILRHDLLLFAQRKLGHTSSTLVAWSVVDEYGFYD